MKIPRFYQNLGQFLKPNKVLVLYGSRQVGKTTLLKEFLRNTSYKYKLDNGDNLRTQQILSSKDITRITAYLSGCSLYALDEAQQIPEVGRGLKIIVDNIPNIRVIATGSSSFELSGQVGEPLTGRKRTLTLFPVSQIELVKLYNPFELKERLLEWLIFGGFPEVVAAKNFQEKTEILNELVNSYLLKDILTLEKVKGSGVLLSLLRLLAFQIGSEVSLSELGTKLALDYKTVRRYLDLLEKTFVIFSLPGYSRNLRKEITKKMKYYFYDNGIRNALIANFNELALRNDIGQLWENFLASERIKTQHYHRLTANNYFWRTWDKKEIDWLEEREGNLFGFEFKYAKEKVIIPKDFIKEYPHAKVNVVSKKNYLRFLEVEKL